MEIYLGFYCHRCALELGLLENVFISDPLQSPYQYEKFKKHTALSTSYSLQSVFGSTSTGDYADYVVRAGSSGALEIDRRGRRNLIVLATSPTGVEYRGGLKRAMADSVKVVLSSAADQVHAFPFLFSNARVERCANCGTGLST
jgi:hypothetical protein